MIVRDSNVQNQNEQIFFPVMTRRVLRPLFIVWCRLKPFEQFAVCTETVF